jgi:hypothetical protein
LKPSEHKGREDQGFEWGEFEISFDEEENY